MQPALEIVTAENPTSSVIWLHGLGADGHDFESVPAMLGLPHAAAVRFVFPNAPMRPVTVNGGMRMRAWYDIVGIGRGYPQDEAGIRESEALVREYIARETERSVRPTHIVLAGFSQGGAIALHAGLRYPESLAGILALSTYLPLADQLTEQAHAANRDVPILMLHGTADPVVPLDLAELSRDRLRQQGYQPQWRTYAMQHSISTEELGDIGDWLRQVLSLT